MDDGHMFDYGQLHKSVFCECKCNFRIALMYNKSFLFPPVTLPTPKNQPRSVALEQGGSNNP